MLYSNSTRRENFSKDPAVIKFNGKYYLYHTIPPQGNEGYAIGIAVSEDMENWKTEGQILPAAKYEENGLCAPAAIVLDGMIHLFYQTYGNGECDAICHATSKDGMNFERDKTNPVYSPTNDWCCGRAIDADVCVFQGKLYLYIATRDHDMKIQKIGAAYADINSDFSKDTWTQALRGSVLVPELKWEQACIEAPATIEYHDKIYMFYGGAYNCKPQQIGCAVSKDGVLFERLFTEPFIRNGQEGTWNASESGHPYVFRDEDGKTWLFYQGSPDGGKTWFISKCEIGWENEIPVILDR